MKPAVSFVLEIRALIVSARLVSDYAYSYLNITDLYNINYHSISRPLIMITESPFYTYSSDSTVYLFLSQHQLCN